MSHTLHRRVLISLAVVGVVLIAGCGDDPEEAASSVSLPEVVCSIEGASGGGGLSAGNGDPLSVIRSNPDATWVSAVPTVLSAAPPDYVFAKLDDLTVLQAGLSLPGKEEVLDSLLTADSVTVLMTTRQAEHVDDLGERRAYLTLSQHLPDPTAPTEPEWIGGVLVWFDEDGVGHHHGGCEKQEFSLGLEGPDQGALFEEVVSDFDGEAAQAVFSPMSPPATVRWEDQPASERFLDPVSAPPEVMEGLDIQSTAVAVPPSWRTSHFHALCSLSPMGKNECQVLSEQSPDPVLLRYYQSLAEPFPVTFYLVDLSGSRTHDAPRLAEVEVAGADLRTGAPLIAEGDLSAGETPRLSFVPPG